MTKTLIAAALCLLPLVSFSQTDNFNFGLEKTGSGSELPDDWFLWGMGYKVTIDTLVKHGGNNALRIEPASAKGGKGFGCPAYSIPAEYEGKEITLTAWLKLENVADGNIGLLLRIDGEAGVLEFENLQSENIQGTADWKQYTVNLPLPKAAKTIYIGTLLSGSGVLWADDFQVLIDGKDISTVARKKSAIYAADSDKEFDAGSGITAIELSPETVENLTVLGQVWGFLKYYHPAVAAGEYNWDYELFRILPRVLAVKSIDQRNELLSEWVAGLGVHLPNVMVDKNKAEIKMSPDLSWIKTSTLGDKLSAQLSGIRDADRAGIHYYIAMTPNVGNPIFKNEKAYPDARYPDAGYRLLALYRYWNIIQYFFPYKYLIQEDWNGILPEFVPKLANASNDLQYRLALLELIGHVHDSHAGIWGKDATLKKYRGENYAPAIVSFVENKAVITDHFDETLFQETGLRIGDVVETINGRSVDEIVKASLPITPASNYPTQLRNIAQNLLRTNDTLMTIGYRRGAETGTAKVKCYPADAVGEAKRYNAIDTCFKMLSPDIAWLYPGKIKNDYLETIMPQIMKTKGLVIDFRCYPSDFIVFSLSEYLLPKSTPFVKFSNGSITTPGLFTMTDALKAGNKNKDHYKGKVVIIVNETTQSSAEYHTMAFRRAPNATVIGSTTAGADGNVSQFSLPGGISTMITGIGVYYPDGGETQRIGIVPDVEVKPTIKGVREGRDEVLEKAMEIIRGAKKGN